MPQPFQPQASQFFRHTWEFQSPPCELIFPPINFLVRLPTDITCLLQWRRPHKHHQWCGRWYCWVHWTYPQSVTHTPRYRAGTAWMPGCCPACRLYCRSWNILAWCHQPVSKNFRNIKLLCSVSFVSPFLNYFLFFLDALLRKDSHTPTDKHNGRYIHSLLFQLVFFQ